ncbi:MAG: carboxypeptidase regulatory-like domain-containing protein [Tannerellaceae bacterium]|jgi:hypothetical protein|nr:carboxypeptidase regulatory-like domain-containing protein [Tannerellaceae bacterium]
MKKFKFISMLSILVCLWMLSSISCEEKDPLVVQGNIEGMVVDAETDQAIPGVNVTIVANSSTTFAEQSKLTGSDGKFSFKDLEAGNYKLTFSKDGYEDNSKNINLSAGQTSSSDVSLTPVKPVLSVSSVLLDFGMENNILPIEISNIGKGELDWSIVEDLAWLSVNPTSGKTTTKPASIAVTIDRTLFTETSKSGTFVINSNGGSATVNISAGRENPILAVSRTHLDFGIETNNLTFEVSNTGKGELNWSIVEDLAWLSVNPASGKTTTTASVVTITVDRTQLMETSKTATFLVNSNVGSATINVSISKPTSVLNVTPASLDFGETETEKSINVSNAGVGTLSYETTASQSWITIENGTNSVTTDTKIIKVTVSRAGLSPSSYTGNVVINSNSNSVTVPVSMTVIQPSAPGLLNGQASGITYSSAQVSGTLTSLGSSAVTQHGHCWSTSPNPTVTDNKTTLGGTSVLKSFSSNITGLSANTTYYVKAYATNAIGTTYSDAITFTTLPPPTLATVQTLRTENVKRNQISGVGNLTVLGDGLVTDHGFCYSTSNAMPTTSDSKRSLGQTTQVGEFTAIITGLQQATKYYLRAYAVNSKGTAYGSVIEATTTDPTPIVTSGLVAYYTFDDDNCAESQGKAEYNGIKQGSGNPVFSTDIPGGDGKSLQLNKDAYFYVPTGPINRYPGTFSYSVWLKTMTVGNTVIDFQTTNYRSAIYISTNNTIANQKYSSYYDYAFNIDVSGLLLDGGWHLLNITRNSGVFKLYIDGIYYASVSSSSTYSDNVPMFIGNGFTGKMDNFRIYNRELTQAEITEIYNAKQ